MTLTLLPAIMAFVSTGIMVYSVLLVVTIFKRLPKGEMLKWWKLLLALISVFATCYLGFALAISQREQGTSLQLAVTIFFIGAVYVLLTLQLFNHTLSWIERSGGLAKNENIDEASGIYNLRFYETRLQAEFERARRYNHPLSVLLIEIDAFQKTSGMYGSMMSDKAFAAVCNLIKDGARTSDTLARYGGDQLVMLLPHTALYSAMKAAEKYRAIIEGKVLDVKDVKDSVISVRLNYTISIGVATLQSDIKQAAELTRRADIALYKAKDRGRNRVALYGE